MGIEQTPEWKQSIKMRPACDRVLTEVFDIKKENIIRYQNTDNPHILDKEFAIDLKIVLNNKTVLTGQEKTLSNKFYKYRTFTVEFCQNRHTEELGELFKIASQFYLHGYSDKSGEEFAEWYIIKVFDFIDWLKTYPINKLMEKTRPAGGSRASFLPIKYDDLPKRVIYAKGCEAKNTKILGEYND